MYGKNKRFAEKIFALLSTGVLQIKQKYYFDFNTKVNTRLFTLTIDTNFISIEHEFFLYFYFPNSSSGTD